MNQIIDTPRLSLVVCDEELCRAILQGDEVLSDFLKVRVAKGWTEFGPGIFEFTLEQVVKDPTSIYWWSYLILLKEPQTLIGSCGFKGHPDIRREVEIGYEIAPAFRNQGFATETAQKLIDFAAQFSSVSAVKAHTLPFESPSTHVLKKCGLAFIDELFDPDEGTIWQWKLFMPHPA